MVRCSRSRNRVGAVGGPAADGGQRRVPRNGGRIPPRLPRPGLSAASPSVRRADRRVGHDARFRGCDGDGRSLDLRGLGHRFHDPAAYPGGISRRRPSHAARRRCGGGRRSHLQGAGNRCDLRARGAVPGSDGTSDAASGARGQRERVRRLRGPEQRPADLRVRERRGIGIRVPRPRRRGAHRCVLRARRSTVHPAHPVRQDRHTRPDRCCGSCCRGCCSACCS